MSKIAVFFPGIGYSCEKPLLYYTASMARDYGYEIIKLDYGQDIHSSHGRTPQELDQLIKLARKRILPRLLALNLNQYDEVLFVSKSIGTILALEMEIGIKPPKPFQHFLFTPLEAAFPYISKANCVFFSGTSDPYVPADVVRSAGRKYASKNAGIFEKCNHSLEIPGDTLGNLTRMNQILECFQWVLKQNDDFPV